ncbi:hypothetical protein [Shinella zoogloeoides]|uniref:Uncharacterized protein n=1 Tax=Shinella zoogloeoides TaxID=352475 RepID=A0A6N8TPZ1_SHIZO|nr:hypothetical protein [Shinella zoogloeoides]MXO03130.1 hypothetical protein [Shinella zoogloeoides]UEX81893.1 hypothetical protein K8M09_00880 [Shinella zoogloeoides]
MTANSERFFKPTKTTADKKASETNLVAWRIIDQETTAREKKTEKLRALRLIKEMASPAPLPKRN